jgi:hypothetical protein
MRGKLIAIVCVAATPLVLVATAAADQSFHTSHADVHSIAGAPLRSGFVNDIHTQGVTIGAQERYQLNGAEPNTTYSVALWIYVGSGSCAGATILKITTETFTTNAAGNGEAGFTFPAGPNPPLPQPIPIKWVFSSGGVPVYESDCVLVTLG